jgi:hypothetical protein
MLPRAIDEPPAGQKLQQVVAGLEEFLLDRHPAPHQIPHPFFGDARDPHRGQLAGAEQPGELSGIVLVLLALDPRLDGNQRGGDHGAGIAPRGELPRQHVAGAAGLVANLERAVSRQPREIPLELGKLVGSRSTRLGLGAAAGSTASVIDAWCTSIPT